MRAQRAKEGRGPPGLEIAADGQPEDRTDPAAAVFLEADSAVWPRWRKVIAETSSIPIYDHSLDGVARAFSEVGFNVGVRPLDLDAFMPVTVGSEYFPKVVDQLRYYSQDKVLFRFVRQSS